MNSNNSGFNSERSSFNVQVFNTNNEICDNHYTYEKSVEYWLIILGFCIGYGSFWRFPYLIYSCGGGIFLIPFIISLFFIGIPIFTLESMLGQILRKGPYEIFTQIHKKYTGIGLAPIIIVFVISIYYAIILCWSFHFFYYSFFSPLPWNNDDTEVNILNIKYFRDEVLRLSKGIEELSYINWELFVFLVITYLMVYISIYNGIKTSSKVVYFTAITPFLLILILLYKCFSLEGYEDGLKFLFIPDMGKLFNIDIWIKASNQVVFTLGIGLGCNILFSSSRKPEDNIYQSSLLIPIITLIFGLLCAIINFCFIGYLSKKLNIPINQLPISGLDLAFVTYPGLLSTFENRNLWSILFFFMMILIGIDSQFAGNELCAEYLYKFALNKYTDRKTTTLIICIIGVLLGIPFITNGGFYLFTLVDQSASVIGGFLIILLEVYIVINDVGLDLLKEMNNNMTKRTIPGYIYLSLEKICPIYILILLITSIINSYSNKNVYNVSWPYILEAIIVSTPLLFIAYFFLRYRNENYNNTELLIERILPN